MLLFSFHLVKSKQNRTSNDFYVILSLELNISY